MLTLLDLKAFECFYTLCSKFALIPMVWKNGKLVHKRKQNHIYYWFLFLILLFELILRMKHLSVLMHRRDIDGCILQIIFGVKLACHLLFRMSIWLFSAEFIRLTNQCLEINSRWGKIFIFVCQGSQTVTYPNIKI